MGIKFDNDPLVVEQNHYQTKIVNVYIVFDLDAWQKSRFCLFGATSIVKKSNQEKYVYSGYEVAFNGWSWSFENDTAGNVVTFGVDNSLSSHADNLKNSFFSIS